MELTLDDSPFCPLVADKSCPQRLLLLGSGKTPVPSRWEPMPSVRFNLHTLIESIALQHPPYRVVVNRAKSARFRKSWYNKFDPKPLGIEINSKIEEDVFTPNNAVPIRIATPRDRDLGAFFMRWRKNIQKRNGKFLKFSMGFYATVWLIGSQSQELYLAGFDGHLKAGRAKYEYHAGGPSCTHHDLDLEWEAILEAKTYAKRQGKKVHIAT